MPFVRAPSLDTINRTYRNIDIAIQHQMDDVANLTTRIAKLKVTSPAHGRPSRDARLPDQAKRPFNVTPHVAVTTAAALNAERSAQKLKRALLAVRKEPLLNTQAASAPPPPRAFQTPQKGAPGLSFGTPVKGLLFPQTPSTPLPVEFTFPEDDFSPSPFQPSPRRGAGVGTKRHSLPVKRSPAQPSPSPLPPPTFEWGPLPSFMTPEKKPASLENSLGGSWVADDFRKKA